jgi:hypothetical protein
MIAKAIKGKGFRGALEYNLKKEQGRIIDTNMDGRRPRELAAEFGEDPQAAAESGQSLFARIDSSIPKQTRDGRAIRKNRLILYKRYESESKIIRHVPPHRHRTRTHSHGRQPHLLRRRGVQRQPRLSPPGIFDART